MELKPVSLEEIALLRRAKVDSLRVRVYAHDHEARVAKAQCFRIVDGHAEPGYLIYLESVDNDPDNRKRLLEFEVGVPWRGRAREYFDGAVKEIGIEQIEVRTDDGVALEPALEHASQYGWTTRPTHVLYYLETGALRRPARPEGVEIKPVSKDEGDLVVELFSKETNLPAEAKTRESIDRALDEKRLWGLYQDEKLVGTAEAISQGYHRFADIRPVIHSDSRRGGLATYMVGEVSQTLLTTNHRLMATAGLENRALRRMAEKLGLTLAAHRLLLRKT